MARVTPVLLLIAAACLCGVQVRNDGFHVVTGPVVLFTDCHLRYATQAQKNLNVALSQNKLDLFAKLVQCAGAEKAFGTAKGKVTVLAPTDAVSRSLRSGSPAAIT
jgi:hypothetical protein